VSGDALCALARAAGSALITASSISIASIQILPCASSSMPIRHGIIGEHRGVRVDHFLRGQRIAKN